MTDVPPRIQLVPALVGASVASVFVYLAAGVLLGTSRSGSNLVVLAQIGSGSAALDLVASALALAATAATVVYVLRRRIAFPALAFVVGLAVTSLALRGALIHYVDPEWISDYLRYWQRGLALADGSRASVRDLYDQRALLVAYPVASLFDHAASNALKHTNSILLLVVQLVAYDLIRHYRGHRAAQAASVLLLAAPVPALTVLIPSHDLWGLFFFSLALWFFFRAVEAKTWVAVPLLTIFSGVCAYLFEIQRTLGTLLCLALLAAAAISWLQLRRTPQLERRRRAATAILVAASCLGMQPMLATFGSGHGLHPGADITRSASHYMKLAAHSGAMGTATSDWYARFSDRFHDKGGQDAMMVKEFATSVMLSTWVHAPQVKLRHAVDNAPRLFDLGYPRDWDALLRRPEGMSPRVRDLIVHYVTAFGFAFGLLLIWALVRVAGDRRPVPVAALGGLVFLAAASSLLLLLFENKPSNIFPIWLVAVVAIGLAFAPATPEDRGARRLEFPGNLIAGAAMLAGAACLAWVAAAASYRESDGLVLAPWDVELQQAEVAPHHWRSSLDALSPRAFDPAYYLHDRRGFVLRGAAADGARLHEYDSGLYQVMEFPAALTAGDRLRMTRQVCAGSESAALELFVFSPFTRADVSERFILRISVNDDTQRSMSIPFDGPNIQLVTIPLPRVRACQEIDVSLVSNVTTASESWRRASRIEIWMPRLVEATPSEHPHD